MRIVKTFLFILSLVAAMNVHAQQDSVVLYDLTVTLVQPEDTSTSGTTPLDFNLSAFMKVNNTDSVDKIYLKLGTAADHSEFVSDTLTVQFHNGSFCMDAAGTGQHYPFWNIASSYNTAVPYSQMVNVKWLTVWARHKNGHISAKKYLKIF